MQEGGTNSQILDNLSLQYLIMFRIICLLVGLTVMNGASAQDLAKRLKEAVKRFEADSQMKHAMLGFYVMENASKQVVIDNFGDKGLAPASCQKIFTSIAALDMLGPDYIYKTTLGVDGSITGGTLDGNLVLTGTGDPTLGSWRWPSTTDSAVMKEFQAALSQSGVRSIKGNFIGDDRKFETQTTADGWIWEDLGNYYGAGISAINWHENQYDLKLAPGAKEGDSVKILGTSPQLDLNATINELKTGPRGSGDNAYVYLPPFALNAIVRGTIPLGESPFTIAGSFPNPTMAALMHLGRYFLSNGIKLSGNTLGGLEMGYEKITFPIQPRTIATHLSPQLDSINYWFLKRSINLYGEAFLKTIALEKSGYGSAEKGIELVQQYWEAHGIESEALNIMDGSGLSPQNRVTPHALVQALQYAATRPWYGKFYDALPEINNIHMKSGSIGGARSYAGYIQGRDGKQYTFALIVNNYNGSSYDIIRKMWRLLDQLK